MIFVCAEPNHDKVKNNSDYYAWHYKIKKGLGHHLVFPHVDSCLGVACQLKSESVFGGHINGFFNSDFSPASHRAAFADMLEKLKPDIVTRAVIFGDVENWRGYGVDFKKGLNDCKNITCLIYQGGGGVDVMVNIDTGEVQTMKYQMDRDFKTIPATDVKSRVNLYTIDGSQDIRIAAI